MARPERAASALRLSVTAIARGNGIAVRASLGMAEEGADALIELWADNVLEPAGLRMGFGVVDGESVFEEAFSQPMPAHDTSCALAAHARELRLAVL